MKRMFETAQDIVRAIAEPEHVSVYSRQVLATVNALGTPVKLVFKLQINDDRAYLNMYIGDLHDENAVSAVSVSATVGNGQDVDLCWRTSADPRYLDATAAVATVARRVVAKVQAAEISPATHVLNDYAYPIVRHACDGPLVKSGSYFETSDGDQISDHDVDELVMRGMLQIDPDDVNAVLVTANGAVAVAEHVER